MGVAALPAVAMGVGAAAQAGSSIAQAVGSKRQPTMSTPPEVMGALRTGIEGATSSLGALPTPNISAGEDAYKRTQELFASLEAPEPTIDPEAMTRQIGETTALVQAPIRAEQNRLLTQQAGAFGPTSDTRDIAVRQSTQQGNLLAQLMAQIAPQLAETKFNQQLQQLQAALGLGEARINAGAGQTNWISGLQNNLTSQLLGVGSQGLRIPDQTVTPAWTAALGSIGQGVGSIPTTLALNDYLKKDGAGGNSGVIAEDWIANNVKGNSITSGARR